MDRSGYTDIDDLIIAASVWSGRGPIGSGQISDPEGPANRVGYAGYRLEPSSVLYHVRFRWYDTGLGRWLQRDLAGYVDGQNVYSYVLSSPLLAIDPHGLEDVKVAGHVMQSPIRGDQGHSHVDPATGRDAGKHWHIKDGKYAGGKYSHETGRIRLRNGKWITDEKLNQDFWEAVYTRREGKKGGNGTCRSRAEIKQKAADRRARIQGTGAAGMAMIAIALSDTDAAEAQIAEIEETIGQYLRQVEAGQTLDANLSAVAIADQLGKLYGTDSAAYVAFAELYNP